MTDTLDRALTLALTQNAAGDYQTAIYNLVVAVRSLAEQPVANYIAPDGRRWYWNAPTRDWVERPSTSPEPTASGRAVGIDDDGNLILEPSPEPDGTGRTTTQAYPPKPLKVKEADEVKP